MLFSDVIGQAEVKERLIRTVKESRVSHAQLFLGPEGSGKLALALAYAQYINCVNRSNEDSCGHCPSCLQFAKLSHPDLHFLYPIAASKEKPQSLSYISEWREFVLQNSGYVSLEQWYDALEAENKQGLINAKDCNELIKTISFKAYQSEYKVMIIWMVEKLFHAAAPKLLKVLEEPPDKTLFILISENYDQILNTISSRAQLVKIPALKPKDIFEALTNNYNVNYATAKSISESVGGNMADAVMMASSEFHDDEQIANFRNWMLMCYALKFQDLITWIDTASKTGRERLKHFLTLGIEVLRSTVLYNYGAQDLMKINEQHKDFVSKFSKLVHSENKTNINQLMDEFNKAIYHVERNGNAKIILLDLSIKVNKLIKAK